MNPSTRCDCKARIIIKEDNKTKNWFVRVHVTGHNHELTRFEWAYMHKSERKITAEKLKAVISLEEANIRPTVAFNYLSNDAGGDEFVGHTLLDHINVVTRYEI